MFNFDQNGRFQPEPSAAAEGDTTMTHPHTPDTPPAEQTGTGWKFLTPWGTTEAYYTEYPLPAPGEKWGPWIEPPAPAEVDGKACGAGRYHLMRRPDARYAPASWWPWYAQWRGFTGADGEKFSVRAARLRRVRPAVWHRIIRLGWCRGAHLQGADLRGANLQGAHLQGADLRDANLQGADLRDAYLRGANLRGADLRGANLQGAHLYGANLQGANLHAADLEGANLYAADLQGANLSIAHLQGANLRDAYLYEANLRDAYLREADLRDANLYGADLYGATLYAATLYEANYDTGARWPDGFNAAAATGTQEESHV